jgi:hypothetical protein
VTVFDLHEKIVMRANVSDSDASVTPIDKVVLNLTASNGTLIYKNVEMINTTISCGTECWIYEKNYTLQGGDPPGTWLVNVTANDTFPNYASNSTQFEVNVYVSIGLTTNLADGIEFGSLDPNTVNSSSATCNNLQCNISVSSDTNVNVDVVMKVNSYLTRQGGVETISTQYWNSSTAEQPTNPAYQVSTTYDYTNKVGSSLTPGTRTIFNSWLSVPSGQKAGTYNNTLYFCATETGTTNC